MTRSEIDEEIQWHEEGLVCLRKELLTCQESEREVIRAAIEDLLDEVRTWRRTSPWLVCDDPGADGRNYN